jgi:hypothetical protein
MNLGPLFCGAALVAGALAVLTGCQSSKPDPGTPQDDALASVFITNSTRTAITDATLAVFREKGFALMSTSYLEQTYDRKGTRWENLAYGGWFEGVWTRAKLKLNAFDVGVHRLSCTAFRVESHGDRTMEDEKPLPRRHRDYYQDLLRQVKVRAEAAPAGR